MHLVMHHDRFGSGWSAGIDWDYYELANPYRNGPMPEVSMDVMGKDVRVHMMGEVEWTNYKPIDAIPQIGVAKIGRLEDLVHFAPSLVRTTEIIIPEPSVPELMEKILKLQQPEREVRIKRDIMRNPDGYEKSAVPRQLFHAQILSLVA